MTNRSQTAEATPVCNQYLRAVALDLALCVVGYFTFTSGDQRLIIATAVLFYGYGFWVYFRSRFAKHTYDFFKGGKLLGNIFLLVFLGIVSPFVHLFFSLSNYIRCPDSLPSRLYQSMVDSITEDGSPSSYIIGLTAGIWIWLIVLTIFAISYHLLKLVPGLFNIIADVVRAAEPDMGRELIGWLIWAFIALPIYIALIVVYFVMEYTWAFISVILALLITGFVSLNVLVVGEGHWPKKRWIVLGSIFSFAATIVVYLIVMNILGWTDAVAYGSLVDQLTSLPFLITSCLLALVSVPIIARWAQSSFQYLFPGIAAPSNDMTDREIRALLDATTPGDILRVIERYPDLISAETDEDLIVLATQAPDRETRDQIWQRLEWIRKYRYMSELTADLGTSGQSSDS
jgi:hypothetical protein